MSAGHVALKRSLRVNAGWFDPALNAACVRDGKRHRIRIFMLDLSISFQRLFVVVVYCEVLGA